jgi:hypothetical protein
MPDDQGWWSGAVNTKGHFSQMRGYFEARIKVAGGNGLLNAFWGKPVTEDWPPEIDFVEVLGKNNARDAFFTVHYLPGHMQSGSQWTSPVSLADDYHVYGFEWGEKDFVWYVDGIERRRTTDGYTSVTGFGQPFYLMLNVHVKCKDPGCQEWTGVPDETNSWPAYMKVDWVRVYGPDTSISTAITNITSGEVLAPGMPVVVEASASSEEDTISRVEFYVDEEKAGEAENPPYSITWEPLLQGRFELRSRAYVDELRSVYSDPVYITIAEDLNANLIFSGGFEDLLEPWELITSGGAAAGAILSDLDPLTDERSVKIEISNPTTDLMNIILRQKMYFEKDQTYRLSLLARAESDRRMAINVHRFSPYDSYLFERINLTEEKSLYSYRFTASDSTYLGLVDFYLGGNSAAVWIDSIFLTPAVPDGTISRVSDAPSLELFPNPAAGHVNISFTGKMDFSSGLQLMDETGRIMTRIPCTDIKNYPLRMDLSGLPPGIYFVFCRGSSGHFVEKLVHF